MEETENVAQPKKSNNLFYIGLLIVLVVIGLSIFLNGKKKATENQAPTEVTVTPTTVSPIDVVNGAIAIEAGSFYYKPNLIRVKKGEKIKVTLNAVSMVHNFNIDEFNVKGPNTQSGASSTIEFTADKAGEFEFYCSIGQHRANGQVGKLIVTE